jgi:hypothetical protein
MACEVKYDKSHHAGGNAEERIRSRLKNSGGEEADSIAKTGDSARRLHKHSSQRQYTPAWRTKQRRRLHRRHQARDNLMSDADEIANLKRELEAVKATLAPPKSREQREREDREWMSEMHAMREARMNHASPPLSADEVRAMNAACGGPGGVADIVAKGGVHPPSGQIPATAGVGAVRGPSGILGSGTGWVTPPPLSPPPGVAQADRLMDHADAQDRIALARQIAERELAKRMAEPKP